MEYLDFEMDFRCFQDSIKTLPNFYKTSNGGLDFLHEKNQNDFYSLNSEEISDIISVLEELNKAIQINIDENNIDECGELVSLIRKSMGQTYQKSIHHKKTKKSLFKPLFLLLFNTISTIY